MVSFETKIWHPNISSETGAICLDILKKGFLSDERLNLFRDCRMDPRVVFKNGPHVASSFVAVTRTGRPPGRSGRQSTAIRSESF